MRTRLSVLLIIMLSFLMVNPTSAERRINLPVETMTAQIFEENHAALRLFFSNVESGSQVELSDSVQQIMLDALPESYWAACAEMIEHWGSFEENVPGSLVRVVYVSKPDNEGSIQALLAYRCFSYAGNYRDSYFDERLMALTIGEDKSVLKLLPHEWGCHPALALSRFGVTQVYQLGGDPLVTLEIAISSGNPCCDGPSSCDERKINFYLLGADRVMQVASIKKHSEERDESIDNDGEFVSNEIIYAADVTLKENAEGDLSEIVSTYSITENGEVMEEGRLKYVWNALTGMFEEVVE